MIDENLPCGLLLSGSDITLPVVATAGDSYQKSGGDLEQSRITHLMSLRPMFVGLNFGIGRS